MDISLSEDQQFLYETAVSFALEALTPQQIRDLEDDEIGFDRAVWKTMAEMGWAGAPFPEHLGGAETGTTELALIVEALGLGAIPSPIFSTVIEAGMLLLEAGSAAQQTRWLPRIAAGDVILTTAVMEPGGGLLPQQIRAQVKRSGKGFAISGTKLFARDAKASEAMLVAGRSGDGPDDITLVIVSPETPGVSLQRMRAAGGESLWQVTFDNVVVNSDAVLGAPGGAWSAIARMQLRGAAFKAAELVGAGRRSLDMTLTYAATREQFGGPIGRFQAVHHHCAEMYRDLEVCRLLVWQAAASLGDGFAGAREVAMAKAKCSEAIPALTRLAHQIHGAIAYYRDYPLELYYHRAIAAQAAYGDARHHRKALADLLVTDLDAFRGADRHELPVYHV